MEAPIVVLVGITAALGFVALGLGVFVLGTPADGTSRPRGWPETGGAHDRHERGQPRRADQWLHVPVDGLRA